MTAISPEARALIDRLHAVDIARSRLDSEAVQPPRPQAKVSLRSCQPWPRTSAPAFWRVPMEGGRQLGSAGSDLK
jgi:hypothetical protein